MSSNTVLDSPPIEAATETSPTTVSLNGGRVRFVKNEGFLRTLRGRIDGYFEETGQSKRDLPRMYFKTFVIMTWTVASYVLLVFFATTFWQAALAITSLALAMCAVGFNIQHDGGHGAYSDKKWVNNMMAMTLDMLGGSSYVWKRKHNQLHHSFTNIAGHDEDIEVGILGRLSPHQPRYWFHRAQHLYLWFFYGFLPLKWQFVDDFSFLMSDDTRNHPRPKGTDGIVFWGGKLFFFAWAVAIPMVFHQWYYVLLGLFVATYIEGIVLSVVFQLAHVVEDAEFPLADAETNKVENEWAIHQVETTVDFARTSRLVNWYTGGLNYQIEHHLFPKICHLHYPALSKIVEDTSAEFGIKYTAHDTLGQAVGSHYRLLRTLGRPDVAVSC